MRHRHTRTALALIVLAAALPALAATAYLVGTRMGTSITGQPALICTYQYGASQFDRAFPVTMGNCPTSIEVQ